VCVCVCVYSDMEMFGFSLEVRQQRPVCAEIFCLQPLEELLGWIGRI